MKVVADDRSWLVIHNCVNIGLANCLRMRAPGLEIDSVDFGRFRRESAEWLPKLRRFGKIVTTREFAEECLASEVEAERIRHLPIIRFDAYHPDQCYLTHGPGYLKGPAGDYHSLIVTAAHARGMQVARVRSLFTPECFSAFGYFDRWEAARRRLLGDFASAGLAVDERFPAWGARSPFMHTINHPAIHVLHDVASALLEAEGIEQSRAEWIPHDNLLNGAAFPVYPPIAERLSVRGSYLFKKPAQYRCIDLDEFIAGSFATLDALRGDEFAIYSEQRSAYERVLANL